MSRFWNRHKKENDLAVLHSQRVDNHHDRVSFKQKNSLLLETREAFPDKVSGLNAASSECEGRLVLKEGGKTDQAWPWSMTEIVYERSIVLSGRSQLN